MKGFRSTRKVQTHNREVTCATETSMCHQLRNTDNEENYQIAAAVLYFLTRERVQDKPRNVL